MSDTEPNLQILLIEDDEDDFLITRDLLQDAGRNDVQLSWADSLDDGLDGLRSGSYAVGLVDLRLGPDSGLDLIRQARDEGLTTPLILLTGQGDEDLDNRAVELGASDYLVKGRLDGHGLIRSIRYAIDRAQATEQLATSEAHYRLLFDTNPAPMCLLDTATDAITSMNQAAQQLYGYHADDLPGLTLDTLRAGTTGPLDSEGVIVRNGGRLEFHLTRAGRPLCMEVIPRDIAIDQRPHQLLMLTDRTEEIQSNRQMRLLQRGIESTSNGIAIADALSPDMPLIYVNPAFERITGYRAEEVLGRNCRFLQGSTSDAVNDGALQEIRQSIAEQRDVAVVLRNFRKDGSPFWNDLFIGPVRNDQGRVTHFIGVQNDISDKKSAESELAYNVSHDVLTGLPNRSLLEDRLTQACQFADRYGRQLALLFIDLDGFKLINDSLGHRIGDRLLVEVARRLRQLVRSGDTVARLSGDEFIVVLPDLAKADDALLVVELVISEIATPYRIDDRTLHLTASVGIATAGGHIDNPIELLQQADLAMYRAKQMGRNTYQWYSTELNDEANKRVILRNELQDAIDNDQLAVYYQPLVDARTNVPKSVEALIRWQHPERGVISPQDFIPLAEETGQISPLGRWVLERACQDTIRMHARGFRDCTVSVNVSPIQLRKSGFVDEVSSVLQASGLAAEFLELEVVESALLYDTAVVVKALNDLRELGVRISIDDFGTGFSSLSYIKLLPANKIKIDRTFIKDVIKDRSDAAITQGVISMAHHLGLEVVAEGVETEAHAAFLRKHQCDLLQGFAFARPLPFDELIRYLSEGRNGYPGATTGEDTPQPAQTLLLLDDETNILRALTRVLRRDGYRILSTTSVREAFELLAENDVQVIISDQRMPEMSGTEFLSEVKAIYPDTVRIVLSGYTDLKSVTEAINEGAIYKFLTKPWDDQQIRNHVLQAFQLHAAGKG